MKAVVAAFNQEKALVGAFSVITNLRMELFEALPDQLAPQLLLQRVEVRRDGHLQALAGGRRALAAPLGHRPRDLSLRSSSSSSSPTSETPGGRLSFLVLDGLKEAESQTSDYKLI